MKKSRVVLVPCSSYDEEEVYRCLKKGIAGLGGLPSMIRQDEKVLMKLNLVRDAVPERAVTTHPDVAAALARIFHEEGYANVCAGDSPGFGNGKKIMEHLGLAEPFEKYGVRMASFDKAVHVENPSGVHAKEFMLAEDARDADAIVSVSKMKTHALEHLTGAVKNQYGCVQGGNKAKGHTKYPSAESMARMIVDLNLLLKPRLYIMDGIVAMEGNGPTSGDPVPMGLLLFSKDPVALDSVFANLVHADPTLIPTEVAGEQMGLGTWKKDEIEVVMPEACIKTDLDEVEMKPHNQYAEKDSTDSGAYMELSMEEAVRRFGKADFHMIRERGKTTGLMGLVTGLRIFSRKPHIDAAKCIHCGVCVQSCPVEGKALNFTRGRGNPPVYNYKKCIRCFCCQEMCPHKAIYVR